MKTAAKLINSFRKAQKILEIIAPLSIFLNASLFLFNVNPCHCHGNHVHLLPVKSRYHMKRIILITGGARSGKSTHAEELALSLSPNPVYLATARIWDEEFRQRVIRHQERRGPEWTNIEEEKELSRHRLEGRVILIDCVTLWCTNFFFDLKSDIDGALTAAKEEFDRFTAQDATFIFVTNEIGMGATSDNELQRKFTDMQGWMNQYIAARADEVILMVSGIPVKIKE